MRYKPEHRAQSHERILKAIGRGFRTAGYAGVGVDGLARAAGLTSGAFYGHFKSKAQAFRAALTAGLEELRAGVQAMRERHGAGWLRAFADFYLTQKVTCPPAEACALPSLSPEMARSDAASRAAYEQELLRLVDTIAAGLPEEGDEQKRRAAAWALLARLAGGVMLARAVADEKLAGEIATAVRGSIG